VPELVSHDIDATVALQIVGWERKFYPIVDTLSNLENSQGTGLFLQSVPVGFTFAHNYRREYFDWLVDGESEANKICSEIDFIYVSRPFRNRGFAETLFLRAHQKLLETNTQLLFVHCTDKTGRIDRLCQEIGYEFVGRSKKYLHAREYSKSLETDTARQDLQIKLQRGLV
jgi:hypothetical protein